MDTPGRNSKMAERIASTQVRYPFSFVVAGDSGAWPDPTADGIFAQLLRQVAMIHPAPVFFANWATSAGRELFGGTGTTSGSPRSFPSRTSA
jgi:hypothetical protein